MIGVVMAGGRGRRMGARVEKPLVCFRGKPMVVRVVEAVREAGLEPLVATSQHTRATERLMTEAGVEVVRTAAKGFVEDLRELV
ncbi:MAG: NTP transferase domain-containing protein, partial [Euryarchaeota archaeon]|nr:NTP transferase domain-containing protein [Euryarchaeota archaeon]